MDPKRAVRISKRMSKVLRHRPDRLGVELEPGGWVAVDVLLEHLGIDRAELEWVVAHNDKQRFSLDDGGRRIRANQGHSVDVELDLEPRTPPPVLYHGTTEGFVEAIRRDGLRRMRRHHVHLSADAETARRVGARRGRPHVFGIDAAAMARDGAVFLRSANGVWLVDEVPARYLLDAPEAGGDRSGAYQR